MKHTTACPPLCAQFINRHFRIMRFGLNLNDKFQDKHPHYLGCIGLRYFIYLFVGFKVCLNRPTEHQSSLRFSSISS